MNSKGQHEGEQIIDLTLVEVADSTMLTRFARHLEDCSKRESFVGDDHVIMDRKAGRATV